jgi:hypothetical protein
MSSMPEPRRVVVGVDTHAEVHVACVIDEQGRRIGITGIPTTLAGYEMLL